MLFIMDSFSVIVTFKIWHQVVFSMPDFLCHGPWVLAPLIRLTSWEECVLGTQDLWLWVCNLESLILSLSWPQTDLLHQNSWEWSPVYVWKSLQVTLFCQAADHCLKEIFSILYKGQEKEDIIILAWSPKSMMAPFSEEEELGRMVHSCNPWM